MSSVTALTILQDFRLIVQLSDKNVISTLDKSNAICDT
jgi:hypothetical protein